MHSTRIPIARLPTICVVAVTSTLGHTQPPGIPTPCHKGHGTRDTHPCKQTHACKNITFPQLRWRAVKNQRRHYFNVTIDYTLLIDTSYQIKTSVLDCDAFLYNTTMNRLWKFFETNRLSSCITYICNTIMLAHTKRVRIRNKVT